MLDLSEIYLDELDQIASDFQSSDLYQTYLDEEDEDLYRQLCEQFEPALAALHRKVADNSPLQLVSFEKMLLHPALEGLFLPRLLGFSVLRGEVSLDQYKYKRPQSHFKDILTAICESSNFEFLKKRTGQSISIGFGMSSDIWITDLINSFANKRIRYYLQSLKLDRFFSLAERKQGYNMFLRQFGKENYLSADFPSTFGELKANFSELKRFLLYRISAKLDNTNLLPQMRAFLENTTFHNTPEYHEFVVLYLNFFELDDEDRADLAAAVDRCRKEVTDFDAQYLTCILDLMTHGLRPTPAKESAISGLLDKSIADNLSEYYTLLDKIQAKGFTSTETMDAVREFYNAHEGRSLVNECVRETIYAPIHKVITNLETREYHEYFEIHKVYHVYMHIFSNEQFNKRIKDISLPYIAKLQEVYIDKRGKDYQDIRKFVSSAFVEMHFMTEKQVIEMFKTRRKKKTEE